MKETKETLWEDYKEVKQQIKEAGIDHPKYELLVGQLDKIRDKIVKLEEIESENKRDKNRNIMTGISIGTTSVIGIWTVIKTFKFDEVATPTSTLGRNCLSMAVQRMFKR